MKSHPLMASVQKQRHFLLLQETQAGYLLNIAPFVNT